MTHKINATRNFLTTTYLVFSLKKRSAKKTSLFSFFSNLTFFNLISCFEYISKILSKKTLHNYSFLRSNRGRAHPLNCIEPGTLQDSHAQLTSSNRTTS